MVGMIMGRRPNPRWIEREARVSEVRRLVSLLAKPVRKITKRDFIEHDLGSLLNCYQGSPKRALIDAGYEPGPMKRPKGYWDVPENRERAVHEVMEITGKSSTELRKLDFIRNGYSLLVKDRSIRDLMLETGLEFHTYQQETGYWKVRDNRIRAIKDLIETLGKDPSEITKKDLNANGLSTVLGVHHGSLRSILREAGYHIEKKKPPKYWNEKENRIVATRDLVARLDKDPRRIGREDFVGAGLHSLLLKYRDEIAVNYERGEIITYDRGYLMKYATSVERALAEAGLIK